MTKTRALLMTVAMTWMISSAAATAQTIGAAATIAVNRFSGEPGSSVLDTTSGGVAVTVGAPVTPRTGVQLDVAFDRPRTVTKSTQVQQGRLETDYTSEMRTVSVLGVVYPFVHSRVRASVLGGFTFVSFRRTVTLHPPPSTSGTRTDPPPSIFLDRVGAATVGGEIEVFVSPHVAIVPAVRAHSFRLASDLGGFSVRPSIGAKWVF